MDQVHATDDDDDDSSLFNLLPDEIVLCVLNKLIDLKTLCFCTLVCKRFSLIVVQVGTISFTIPPSDSDWIDCPRLSNAVSSLLNFTYLTSLCMHMPYTDYDDADDCWLFKWKINFSNRIDSFVFLLPNSVCETTKGNDPEVQEEIEEDSEIKKFVLCMRQHDLVFKCLKDAMARCSIVLNLAVYFPLLEKVSIKDSCKRGTVSVDGRKLAELRNLLPEQRMSFSNHPPIRSRCYIPLLELPVSGYLMKGVTLFIFEGDDIPDDGDYSFINSDLADNDDKFEDKEEAAFTEAMTEILKNHREQIERLG